MKILLFTLVMGVSYMSIAQNVPKVTDRVFVKSALVTSRAGMTPTRTAILISDGVIEAIGPNLQAPYDAKVIDADSLYVYPGFIAAASSIAIEPPSDDRAPKPSSVGYPKNSEAGIVPERSTSAVYKMDDGAIKDFKESGFGIAHILPEGNMMPGRGSIISLSGEEFDQAAIKKDVSMYAQLKGSGRMFPGTIIGVMTKWREMYKQAQLDLKFDNAYYLNPKGKKRPQADAAIEALYPVVQNQMPVFFKADDALTAHRVLQLQKDLGFNLTMTEVSSLKGAMQKLTNSRASVLVSLDLPDEIKEDKKKEDKKADGDKKEEAEKEAPAKPKKAMTAGEKEMAMLTERKKQAVAEHEAFASTLATANVPFAFSYTDTKAKDVLSSIRRMIKSGLSEDKALAALTENAAKIIGIENIAGTIDAGKAGNLVISTGPLFDEKSKIKMVIVDGVVNEYEIKEKKKGDGDNKLDLVGTWTYTIDIPGMTPKGSLFITKDGDDYKYIITSDQAPDEEIEITDVDIDGNTLSFTWIVPAGGMNINVASEIEVDGDTFEGKVTVPDFGTFDITGSKQSKPE